MRKVLILLLLISVTLYARDEKSPSMRTGIKQIYDIMTQLEDKIGAIPPDIERVAIYRVRVDRDHFNAGMARFIRERIEEVFRRASRREVVTAPELKTIRVDITDTSFNFRNTVPTLAELWDIGKKLRVDGFIDGSCTRTEDGDVLITLKLIRNSTGEIEWSRSFISGPNRMSDLVNPIRLTLGAGGSIVPIKSYSLSNTAYSDKAKIYGYGLRLRIEEATSSSRRFFFGIHAGVNLNNLVPEDESVERNLSYANLMVGGDVILAAFRKKHNAAEYWLGIRLGMQLDKPFSYNRSLLSFRHGYRFNVSDHFSINTGIQIFPFNKTVMNSKENVTLEMETISYEFGLSYTF